MSNSKLNPLIANAMAGGAAPQVSYGQLPTSVQNPYDLSPSDTPEMRRLKLLYAQRQVFGQPIYPPEMKRQPVRQQQPSSLSDMLMSLLAPNTGNGGGGY